MRALAWAGHVVADRYRLQDQIGRGAMGAVWLARDELLDRDVAVKELVISPSLGTADRESLYERTLREAKTAARLNHPGVVTVFDVVEEDGRPWIVMELVRARSLDRVLAEDGPLPAAQAAGIGQQLISALAAAHEAGVLHRDVKPSNVLLCPDGRAVLTDFGIATLDGDSQLTQTGMVMGTPAFIAPERIRGGPAAPASDFWSLGATLYAAVQGSGPYQECGGPMTTMNAVINEEPPAAPSAGELAPVIAALMRRDPAARPDAATAARMLAGTGAATPEPSGAPWLADAPGNAGAAGRVGQPQAAAPAWVPQAGQPDASRPADQPRAADAPWVLGAPTTAGGVRATDQVDEAWPAWPAGAPTAADASRQQWPGYQAGAPGANQPTVGVNRPDTADPPPSGMLYSAPVTQTRSAVPPAADSAAPPEAGSRRAGRDRWSGTGKSRRDRTVLVACVAVAVVAAGVLGGVAVTHFTGSAAGNGRTGTSTGHGKPGTGHPASPGGARSGASRPPKTLPAGYTWYTLPAAVAGTDAGFRTAVPAGWNTTRNGLVTYVRRPSGSGFLEVDLTQHVKAGNLAQARWLQVESIRQRRFPGYRRISLRPVTILGSPAAVWTFSWMERGVGRVIARDYLFSVTARGGATQSYAVYGSAPAADWPQTATALDAAIKTFQPLS